MVNSMRYNKNLTSKEDLDIHISMFVDDWYSDRGYSAYKSEVIKVVKKLYTLIHTDTVNYYEFDVITTKGLLDGIFKQFIRRC